MTNLLLSAVDFSSGLVNYLSETFGIWYTIILNAFGVIAIICKIIEYQVKKRKTMFLIIILASVCWFFYFLLYGNLTSSLTIVLGIIRLLIFMRRDTCKWARSMFWLYLFLVLQVAVVVYTSIIGFSWLDVFALAAGFVGIFAYFVTNPRMYRALSFVHMSLWVVNSGIYFYPVALISDSFSTISCSVAIYRFDLKKGARFDDTKGEKTA